MTPFVLTVLKIAFLVLLYFFVYRAIRVGIIEIRGRPAPRAAQQSKGSRSARRTREPTSIALIGENGKKVRSVRLGGTVQIGRAEACQIRIDDTYASQFHARIFSRNGAWHLEDLGSTNGTYLNQRKVTAPTPVAAGDRVRIGKSTLELRR